MKEEFKEKDRLYKDLFDQYVRDSLPLRSGGGSSTSRNNENLSVQLGSDSPHKSDIVLLDSNEIRELKSDDKWKEILNMQVVAQENEAIVEPLIDDETRELLSYNCKLLIFYLTFSLSFLGKYILSSTENWGTTLEELNCESV